MIKTPETNISWAGVRGWIAAYHQIFGRKHTGLRYRQLTNHRQALTKDIISEDQDIEALEYITKGDSQYFSGAYYGKCPCAGECRCEFTNSKKWWGELQCYAHNRIQCLTFPTRKTIQFMSQTYQTEAFLKLIDAFKKRKAGKGSVVAVNFTKNCLQRVNPKVMNIMNIANDKEWKFLPKPDDAPDKGSPEEQEFIAATKDRYYTQWLKRLEAGEFDGDRKLHIGEDPPEEGVSEDTGGEIDMAELARKEKEKKNEPSVAMVNEPDDEEECMETCNGEPCPNGKECEPHEDEKKVANPRKNRNEGPPSLEHWDKLGPAANLLHSLKDFIAATDSPPEDTPSFSTDFVEKLVESTVEGIKGRVARLEEENAKLKKKVGQLFNALRDE